MLDDVSDVAAHHGASMWAVVEARAGSDCAGRETTELAPSANFGADTEPSDLSSLCVGR